VANKQGAIIQDGNTGCQVINKRDPAVSFTNCDLRTEVFLR